jgi:AraC-like DNA-binding protein
LSSSPDSPIDNYAHFTVNDLPSDQRYEPWKASIDCIFTTGSTREVREENFEATIESTLLGPLMLAHTTTKAQKWNRTTRNIAGDGMDHFMIRYFTKGSTWFDGSGSPRLVGQDGIVVFDLSRPSLAWTTDFENLSLIVPRHLLEANLHAPDDQHLRVLDIQYPLVAMMRDQMASLAVNAKNLSFSQGVEVAPSILGLATSCLNSDNQNPESTSRAHPALALAAIRKFIHNNLSAAKLSPDMICSEMGLSRSKLYQLFEKHGGVTSYIRQQRLRGALIILSDRNHQHRSVYDIALEFGYSNDTAFIRAFRDNYNLTPGDVRNGQVNFTQKSTVTSPNLDRRYEKWLNQLT